MCRILWHLSKGLIDCWDDRGGIRSGPFTIVHRVNDWNFLAKDVQFLRPSFLSAVTSPLKGLRHAHIFLTY